jgi:molybdopterin synthase sulfur carrier subunit
MTITVKYFASLRELIGRSEENLELDTKAITVADVWEQVAGSDTTLPDNILSAINMEYVKLDAQVKDGDEVAFFPPVTGG